MNKLQKQKTDYQIFIDSINTFSKFIRMDYVFKIFDGTYKRIIRMNLDLNNQFIGVKASTYLADIIGLCENVQYLKVELRNNQIMT